MASNTTNYGLTKPDANEYYDISVQNENMDRIDDTLKAAQDKAAAAVTGATFGGAAVPQDGTKLEIPMPNAGQVGASNPNLLINSNFLNPINQRGQTSYAGVGYTIDRWYNRTTNTEASLMSNGLKLKVVDSGHNRFFSQRFENYNQLLGKTVTIAFTIVDALFVGSGLKIALYQSDSAGLNSGYIGGTDYVSTPGMYIATFAIPSTISYTGINFGFYLNDDNAIGDYATVDSVKLEIGSVATPFSPRPYAEELALCQRYYQLLFLRQDLLICDSKQIMQIYKLAVAMRSLPTLMVLTPAYFHTINGETIEINTENGPIRVYGKFNYQSLEIWMSNESENYATTTVADGTMGTINSSSLSDNVLSSSIEVALDAEIY